MLRAHAYLGGILGLGLAACSGVTPKEQAGSAQDGIIGGQVDQTDHAVVGIVIKNQALCTGSLIAPNLVLTARHCVADLSTGSAPTDCNSSRFGTAYSASSFLLTWASDLTTNVPPSSVYEVSEVRVPTDSHFCGNDVALLFLKDNIPDSAATPIAPRVDQAPKTNEDFTAIGYGLTDANDSQGNTAGVRHIVSGMIIGCVGSVACAGSQAEDDEWAAYAGICHGDSGGPALDAQGRVIGVASRADDTCMLGLYSSVEPWHDFIVQAAVDAAMAGGYTPPTWAGGMPDDGGMMDGGTPTDAGTDSGVAGSASGGKGGAGTGATGGSSGRGGSGRGGRTSTGGGAGIDNGSGGTGGSAGRSTGGGAGNASSTGGSGGSGTTPPDAGTQGSGAAPSDGGLVQPGPMLGEACTDHCFGDLVCYASTGKPPGECVPPCDVYDKTCPGGYECSARLGACLPASDNGNGNGNGGSAVHATAGCGCRVATPGNEPAAAWQLAALLGAGAVFMRRRRGSKT